MNIVLANSNSHNVSNRVTTRFKAATIHLLISAIVASIVLLLMIVLWYPAPYFSAAGAGHLLFLLFAVDLIIGPLITLIIFDTKKKSLKFDLATVAALQLAAFLYGMNIVFEARPAYVVFVEDHFEVVSANEIHPTNLAKVSNPEFKSMPLTGPRIVAAVPPTNADEAMSVVTAKELGLGLQIFPQHYVTYASQAEAIVKHGKPISVLLEDYPYVKDKVAQVLKKTGKSEVDLRFLPLRSRTAEMATLIAAKSGEIVDLVSLSE